jgi:hypothetical protein
MRRSPWAFVWAADPFPDSLFPEVLIHRIPRLLEDERNVSSFIDAEQLFGE